MNTTNIVISLKSSSFDTIKSYATATGVSIEDFIEDIITDFIRFQQAEMEEVYLNDDGMCWLMPTGSF